MSTAFAPSGVKSPCPICGRTKDGDCRIASDGRVFCHTKRNGKPGKASIDNPSYVYLGQSQEAQGCGMWKLDASTLKAPRPNGIRHFDYRFWDGARCPVQRFRKDSAGGKQVAWCKGGLGGRPQSDVAPYLWEKIGDAKRLFVVRGELKAELLSGRGFTAISLLNQKDEVLVAKLQAMQLNGVEVVLVPDCDAADLDKWFRYLSNEVPGVKQLLAPGLPWGTPPADGGLGIEDWIYAKSPSNDQIAAAISSARAIDQDAKDLNTLEAKILSIKSTTDDPLKQALLTKKEAAELGFGLSESTAKALIRQTGYKEPVLFGEDINVPAESEAKLWGDLLLYQSSNLVIAPPKVGKTALMLHLAGCMLGGKSHCLGQPIHNRCDQLIILGADMLAKEWTKLLRREGLAKTNPDGSVSMPKVKLAAKGNKLDLSPMGIKSIVTMCKERPNSLLLVDCLRSYLEGDENNREFIAQLERLFVALAEVNCKATVVCIHHARKSGGATAIDASSGHSSIPAAFDQTIKMSWLTAENVIQADKRILVNSTGRGSQDQSIVVELVGIAPAMWISHGDAKDLIKAEAITQALDALSDREEKQYDFVQGFYEKHGLGVSSKLFRLHFDLSQQGADRRLHKFTRRGLLFKIDGQIDPDNPKGTPFAVYVPHNAERVEEWPGPRPCGSRHSSASPSAFLALGGRSDLKGAIDPPSKSVSRGFTAFEQNQEPCSSLETEFSTGSSDSPDPLQRNAHRVHHTSPQEKTGSDPLQRSAHRVHRPPFNSSSSSFIQEEETSKDHSSLAVSSSNAPALNAKDSANDTEALKPQLGQAVQVFRQGEWEGGWTICDSRNPHSLRIRTERNRSVFQLANQRWGIDIRPEVSASPAKAHEAVDGLNPYSKDLAMPSRALEMRPTAREQEEYF